MSAEEDRRRALGARNAPVQVARVGAGLRAARVLAELEPDLGLDVVGRGALAARRAGYLTEPDEVRPQPLALGLRRPQLLRANPGQRRLVLGVH